MFCNLHTTKQIIFFPQESINLLFKTMEKEGVCYCDWSFQVDIYPQTPILLSQLNGRTSSQGTWHVEKNVEEKCMETKSSRVNNTPNIISLISLRFSPKLHVLFGRLLLFRGRHWACETMKKNMVKPLGSGTVRMFWKWSKVFCYIANFNLNLRIFWITRNCGISRTMAKY